jgi:hypothetical protein
MVEPPSDVRGTGILEIDDGIFVAVELLFVEQRAGPVHQPGEFEVDVTANALAIKPRE